MSDNVDDVNDVDRRSLCSPDNVGDVGGQVFAKNSGRSFQKRHVVRHDDETTGAWWLKLRSMVLPRAPET